MKNEPKTATTATVEHVNRNTPIYFWIPGIVIAMLLVYWGVSLLTGRNQFQPGDPSTSADVLINIMYRCIIVVLSLVFTWLVKTQDKLNRPVGADTWQVYVGSRVQTCILIGMFLWVLTH